MKALFPRSVLFTVALLIMGLAAIGCGQDRALGPEDPTTETSIHPRPATPTISPGGRVAIARPYPYNPQPDKVLLNAFQKLMSGDPQKATAGLAVILDTEPQLYEDLLEYFQEYAPDEAKPYFDQLIQEWWQYNKAAPGKTADVTPSDAEGGDKFATFQIEGTIEIKKGSTVDIDTIFGDWEIDLPTDTIPIDTGEMGQQGGTTVSTTTLNLNDAPISLSPSFPIPHPLSPVNSLGVDIETCVNLTITIRRKCKEQ